MCQVGQLYQLNEAGTRGPLVERAMVAFLDGWRPCTITQVHEGTLDWPEKRVVVALPNGAELEVENLAALAVPAVRKRRRRK